MAKPPRRLGNLPAETMSFLGRRRELAEVKKRLSEARLVTLVGPGGVGKTRLAVRAAAGLGRGFSQGAWLVELAEVEDPSLVANAVLGALELRDQAATEPRDLLLAYLEDRSLLMVLDNCEHLAESAAAMALDIIRAAPGVRVLATSREPLSVTGEHIVPVPPFDLPPADGSLAQLLQSDAVALFTERAAAASGTFALTETNRAAVAGICRRLDGLPLAIELAAVRTRALTAGQILERLADRFALLTGGGRAALPRHQTLRTAIDWSYDLLSDEERTVLRRLCVFAGRFTLEDVEAVCTSGAPPAFALERLSSLVDKSLVIKEEVRGLACYRLHETMREYAELHLGKAGEESSVAERCLEHYRSTYRRLADRARYQLPAWLERTELEIDNLRAVLRRYASRGELERGIDLATALGWYWITRATTEGVHWLDELLAGDRDCIGAHGRAYFLRGFLAVLQANPESARPWLERAAVAARMANDPQLVVESLAMHAVAANTAGDREPAVRLLSDARALAGGLDDREAAVAVLQARTLNAFFEGDLDTAKVATTEGVRMTRESGDLYGMAMMLGELGGATLLSGNTEEAKPLYIEALRVAQRLDDRVGQSYFLDALAFMSAGSGQARRAAQLLGAAEAMRTGAGAVPLPFMIPLLAQAREAVIAAISTLRFEGAFEEGRGLSRDAAVALAADEPRIAEAAADGGSAGPLGKREVEVARLVAGGLSNKQIGARLFISERTVDSHVRSILNKLGFNSRVQIAAWMAASDRSNAALSQFA